MMRKTATLLSALLLGGLLTAPPARAGTATASPEGTPRPQTVSGTPGDATPANLTIRYMLTKLFRGSCDGSFPLTAEAMITSDRDTDVDYRVVVDGKPGPTRTQRVRAGVRNYLSDFWYNTSPGPGSGRVRIEVLNHNKPSKEEPYSWKCLLPSPNPVRISEISPMAYYGDCAEAPYMTAYGAFEARPGVEITYRWTIDGVQTAANTLVVPPSGVLEVQAGHWWREPKQLGIIGLEVLNHQVNKLWADYPVTCQS
ncbi:hypothetical protein FHS43_006507 [Streptosporangium becharense]|uniref:PKD domain-containing protein n=1 Tax=Streptosporangium becharense TaxID=1816182 RepID=A0A7W9IC49_9ACTN|nr:hypothetical protein [Streptosporangium becharense]MBB2915187.1 hypothetical protein [Streptosporangium becharense]MBB5817984.1 hypothetical protein [Streptosporangium becharense]